MAEQVQLEEAERLASQLPFPERLKLVARICQQLSAETPGMADQNSVRQQPLAELDSWLAGCDALRERIQARFDTADEIRQIREQRAGRP